MCGDGLLEIRHRRDAVPVDGGDHVSLLEARLLGGAAVSHLHDQCSLRDLEVILLRGGRGDVGACDPQYGALHGAILLEITDHLVYDGGGDGKGDPGVVTGAGVDHRIDPDQFACHIDQRPAGVARIHRHVRLDEGAHLE